MHSGKIMKAQKTCGPRPVRSEAADPGVGDYFRDSIIADLRRLEHYFGQHAVHFGFHRALSDRFPHAIYYRDDETTRTVVAVLDMRRDPSNP